MNLNFLILMVAHFIFKNLFCYENKYESVLLIFEWNVKTIIVKEMLHSNMGA